MTAPVTVSITRHLDPGREAEMVSWMQAGIALAERFPGFLGAGWVRPERDSETWHVLYRFADAAALSSWESSHQRQWWRDSSSGLGVVGAGSTSPPAATSATCGWRRRHLRAGSRPW